MSHTLEVIFAEDVRHRRRDFHRRFCLEERMIAFFITAAIIRIIIVIVMKKCCFATNRTGRIFPLFRWKWFCTIWTTWNKIRLMNMSNNFLDFSNIDIILLTPPFNWFFEPWWNVCTWFRSSYCLLRKIRGNGTPWFRSCFAFIKINKGIIINEKWFWLINKINIILENFLI